MRRNNQDVVVQDPIHEAIISDALKKAFAAYCVFIPVCYAVDCPVEIGLIIPIIFFAWVLMRDHRVQVFAQAVINFFSEHRVQREAIQVAQPVPRQFQMRNRRND